MKLAVIPIVALSVFAAAETVIPHEHTALKFMGELGAFGFLAWYCWYDITRARPRQTKSFQDEAKEARQHDSDMIIRLSEAHEKVAEKNQETIEKMIDQCATRSQQES